MISPPVGLTASQLWDAIKAGNQTHVKVEFPVQGVTLTDEDINLSQGVSIEDIFNAETNLAPGCAVMKQVNIGVLGSSKTVDLDWTEEFTLSFGVEVSGVTYWTAVGKYQGERPEDVMVADAFMFTAYDRMKWFDISADNLLASIGYPQTVGNLYNKVCTSVGITGTIQTGLNPTMLTRQFTSAPFEGNGYTCRDLLSWIAEACGVYARINADGECVLTWFTDNTSHTVEPNQEFHVEHAELFNGYIWQDFDQLYWYEADKLTWAMACGYQEAYNIDYIQVSQYNNDADAIYPGVIGTNAYMVVGNPFLAIEQYEDIENYVIPIYNRIHSFGGHLPARIECIGNWLVEAGDIITAYVSDVDTIQMPIFCRTLRWNGAITAEYETTGTIRWNAVSASNKEKIWTRNSIRLIANDQYYQRQSGIEIVPEGIDISGSRYINLKTGSTENVEGGISVKSGGVVDVESGGSIKVESGADMTLKSGGKIDIKSGGNLNVESGGNIDINGTGNLKLSGSTVEIKSGSTFDVDATNFKIDSTNKTVTTGEWTLQQKGLVSRFTSPYGYGDNAICYGRWENIYEVSNIPTMCIASSLDSNSNTDKYGCSWYSIMRQKNGDMCYMLTWLNPSSSTPNSGIQVTNEVGDSYTDIRGLLGSDFDLVPYKNKWEICASAIRYDTISQRSSRDIKHDIRDMESQGEKLDNLRPVTFIYDDDAEERTRYGLIYEEVMETLPDICIQGEGIKAVSYMELVPMLLKEIQDLRKRVAQLEEREV